jgi:anthranilate phosphoribosyltransferase
MLKVPSLTRLFDESTPPEEAREILLRLTPDNTGVQDVSEVMAQIYARRDQRFDSLSTFADIAFDCCGTGGSGLPRFNTSTAVAFVLAAAGVKVAKFGNRAAGGRSGSFDVLGILGIPPEVDANVASRLLDDCNLVFLFAPQVFPTLARLSPVRKSIKQKTILNFVGPLLNPVKPTRRVVGVSDPIMVDQIADVLDSQMETHFACVIKAECGLDEACANCGNHVRLAGKHATVGGHNLQELGVRRSECVTARSTEIDIPTPEINAAIMMQLFAGEIEESEAHKLVVENSALALVIAARCQTLDDGRSIAREILASGRAKQLLVKVQEQYAKHSA